MPDRVRQRFANHGRECMCHMGRHGIDGIGEVNLDIGLLGGGHGILDHRPKISAFVFEVMHGFADHRHRLVEGMAELPELIGMQRVTGAGGNHLVRIRQHDRTREQMTHIVVDLACDACAFGEPRMLQVRRSGGFDIDETSARTADTFPLVVCQRLEAPLSSLHKCEYPAAESGQEVSAHRIQRVITSGEVAAADRSCNGGLC